MVVAELFNPNEHQAECEVYLSRTRKRQVRFVHAELLTKRTRDAPWRLDAEGSGGIRRYVLRLEIRRSEHEYEVLRARVSVPIPTPQVYGWHPAGKAFGVLCFLSDFVEGETL